MARKKDLLCLKGGEKILWEVKMVVYYFVWRTWGLFTMWDQKGGIATVNSYG